jgi:membrane associated rhomboid family serine protease
LFGRSAFHIGASGLVFGYFGFLVAVGLYERRIVSLAIASVTLFYYGGMIFGVLPVNSFVSWEGHLFGLVAGIVAARTFAARRGPAEESAS